jgi:adenylate cyclase
MEEVSNPYLEWLDKDQKTLRVEIIDRVFIGRLCKGVDETKKVIVSHPMVSRDHAEIIFSGSRLKIKDISKNGTWVNGVRIAGGSSEYLKDGDVIRVGDTTILVQNVNSLPPEQNDSRSGMSTDITPKEVTVTNVVADVRGFTGMSESENSYQVYALMKELFKRYSVIVNKHKGTVKDYVGDAIYAFWDHGVNASQEQALLACLNALAQAKALNSITYELRSTNPVAERLKMGWGITTGPVTLSHYGSRASDLALVGDCTNLAFRLSGMANKELDRDIVICANTANLVRDTLEVEDLGEVPVRGRKDRLLVFGL